MSGRSKQLTFVFFTLFAISCAVALWTEYSSDSYEEMMLYYRNGNFTSCFTLRLATTGLYEVVFTDLDCLTSGTVVNPIQLYVRYGRLNAQQSREYAEAFRLTYSRLASNMMISKLHDPPFVSVAFAGKSRSCNSLPSSESLRLVDMVRSQIIKDACNNKDYKQVQNMSAKDYAMYVEKHGKQPCEFMEDNR